MKTSLTRSIGFWLLLVLSLAAAAVGGWLISGQLSTMTTTLTDGTATGVEVYVGQSLVVVGAVLLGSGAIGVLLVLALTALQTLIPSAAPASVEPTDWSARNPSDDESSSDADGVAEAEPRTGMVADTDAGGDVESDEDQNGRSGSTATATKISVK